MLDRNVKEADEVVELTDDQAKRLSEIRQQFVRSWERQHGKDGANFDEVASRVCLVAKNEMEKALLPFQVKNFRAIAAARIVNLDNRRDIYSCNSLIFSNFALELLNVTSDQRSQIEKEREAFKTKTESLFAEEYETSQQSFVASTEDLIDETLSPTQAETLSDFLGTKIEFEKSTKTQNALQSRLKKAIWFVEDNSEGNFNFVTMIQRSIPRPSITLEFTDSIAEELGLTPAQRQQITKLKEELESATRFGKPEDIEQARTDALNMRRGTLEKLQGVLVPAQKRRLEQLLVHWSMMSAGIIFDVQLKPVRDLSLIHISEPTRPY